LEPDRDGLEDLWHLRLSNAKLRLRFARDYVIELQRDRMLDLVLPSPDGSFAYQQALRAETYALAEYRHVLQILTDLILDGKIPDEKG
jgi:hypothetical protein